MGDLAQLLPKGIVVGPQWSHRQRLWDLNRLGRVENAHISKQICLQHLLKPSLGGRLRTYDYIEALG